MELAQLNKHLKNDKVELVAVFLHDWKTIKRINFRNYNGTALGVRVEVGGKVSREYFFADIANGCFIPRKETHFSNLVLKEQS